MNIDLVRSVIDGMSSEIRATWSKKHLPEGESIDAVFERWERYDHLSRFSGWAGTILLSFAIAGALRGWPTLMNSTLGVMAVISMASHLFASKSRANAALLLEYLETSFQ